MHHTGLIQFDIDLKDNPRIRNFADLKAKIAKLPFVAYCGLSASARGYWGLVPIAYPERHGQHFDAMMRVFTRHRIALDTKPRNVASARCYSYDLTAYLPEKVHLFELYDVPKPPPLKDLKFTADADKDRQRVEVCVAEIVRRGEYVADYGDWYEIGCSFANTYGESGRQYFHLVSQHYPKYSPIETDKQFTACLKGKSKATLGSFFHFCKQLGIEYKDLLEPERPYTPPAPRSQPTKTWDHPKPGITVTPQPSPQPAPAPSPIAEDVAPAVDAPAPVQIVPLAEVLAQMRGLDFRQSAAPVPGVEYLTVTTDDDYPVEWDAPKPSVEQEQSPLDRMVSKNPALSELISSLNLEVIDTPPEPARYLYAIGRETTAPRPTKPTPTVQQKPVERATTARKQTFYEWTKTNPAFAHLGVNSLSQA